MGDARDIVEVKELTDPVQVNELLAGGEWDLLSACVGQDEENHPITLYCLGRPYRDPGRKDIEWV